MSYLLDTCVISELTREDPHPSVMNWFDNTDEDQVFISSITIGELTFGINILDDGKKKNDLVKWFNDVRISFQDSTIPVSDSISIRWGRERAVCRKKGIQVPVVDGLIGCTAIEHNMVLVTRNTNDYRMMSVQLYNPWE